MNSIVKPPYFLVVHRGHALARSLRGAWLLNEGRGNMLWDASGAGLTGALTDMDPSNDWVGGPQGYALDFDGTNDRVIIGPEAGINLGTANACVIRLKVRYTGSHALLGHKAYNDGGYFFFISGAALYYCANGYYVGVPHGMAIGDEVWLGVSRQGTSVVFYKDGVQLGTPQTLSANSVLSVSSIGGYRASPHYAANMRCDYVYCWNRSLSSAEMAWLYRDPFCIVARRTALPTLGFAGATVHYVSGSVASGSTAIADAEVIPLADRRTGRSWCEAILDMGTAWRREALLNGMTDTAVKLGTALTQGWFWMRRTGCIAVHRVVGRSTDVGSSCPVAVAAAEARSLPLPTYLSHDVGSTHTYIVRRFNSCGQQDHTIHAAVVACIGLDGQLAMPSPNAIVGLTATQKHGCAYLHWSYWPLDHPAAPRAFNVYWDGGTGTIDFATAIAVAPYERRQGQQTSRLHHHYQSQPLQEGTYSFAVRAESMAGPEGSPRISRIEISSSNTGEGMDVLDAEAL